MGEADGPVRAMGFIDGQNLFQHAKAAFGHIHPNYDPVALHRAVCLELGWEPTLVRFYTGIPSHSDNEMWAGYWAKRILFMKNRGVHVTTRRLRYRDKPAFDENGNRTTVRVPQEKGIDVRLALDIVSTARKRQWDACVIFSQDQDLAEVVAEIGDIAREQSRTLRIACAFPSGPAASSKRGIDRTQWFRMDQAFYDACLDPADYRPSRS
jgi:uncharacterized LabA/DUF88 family protein